MNYFTKEELEEIEYGLLYSGMENTHVLEKLQSLIDNYCEHKDVKFMRDVGVETCRKCGKVIDENSI